MPSLIGRQNERPQLVPVEPEIYKNPRPLEDERFQERVHADPEILGASMHVARNEPPSWWAEKAKAERVLRVPGEMVSKDNLPTLSKLLADRRDGPALSWAPNLQHRLLDPAFAGVMQNDIEPHAFDERFWSRTVKRGFVEGIQSAELGLAGIEYMKTGSPEARARAAALQKELSLSEYRRQPGFFSTILTETTRQIGQQVGIAIGEGGSIDELVESPAAEKPFRAAMLVGDQLTSTLLIEGGSAYIEATDLGIPEEHARTAALTIGVLNQLLDYVTLGVGGRIAFAPVRGQAKKAIVDTVKGNVLGNIAVNTALVVGTEVATEMLQEVVNMEEIEHAKRYAPVPLEAMTDEEYNSRLVDAAVAAAAGTVFLGAGASGTRAWRDVRAAKRARLAYDAAKVTRETVTKTESAKTAPEQTEELVQSQAENAGLPEEMNIDVETLKTVLGKDASAFLRAVNAASVEKATLEDSVVTFKVARGWLNEHFPKIEDHVRYGEEADSKAEADEYHQKGMHDDMSKLEQQKTAEDEGAPSLPSRFSSGPGPATAGPSPGQVVPLQRPFTDADAAALEAFVGKITGGGARVELVSRDELGGMSGFYRRARSGPLIQLAADHTTVFETGGHEAMHFLRDAGAFTNEEWGTLMDAARHNDWFGLLNVERRWGKWARESLPEDRIDEALMEEAIVEAGAWWNTDREGRTELVFDRSFDDAMLSKSSPQERSRVKRLFTKLMKILARIREWLVGEKIIDESEVRRSGAEINAQAMAIFERVFAGEQAKQARPRAYGASANLPSMTDTEAGGLSSAESGVGSDVSVAEVPADEGAKAPAPAKKKKAPAPTRALSTAEQKAALKEWGFVDLFKTAEEAGFESAAQYKRYMAARAKASETAARTLKADTINNEIKDLKEDLIRQFKAREDLGAENRVYGALSALADPEKKLDRDALRLIAAQQDRGLQALPKAIDDTLIYVEDGMDPQVFAELFDYSSADALVRDMLSAIPIEDFARAQADRQLQEQGLEVTRARQELYAVLNPDFRAFIQMELDLLHAKNKARQIKAGHIAAYVTDTMRNDRLRDMTPRQYAAIARRKGRAAGRAVAEGRWQDAAVVKFQQRVALERAYRLLTVERRMVKDRRLVTDVQRHRRQHPRLPVAFLQALRTYMGALSKTQGKGLRLFREADETLTREALYQHDFDLEEFARDNLGEIVNFPVPEAHERGWTFGEYQDVMNTIRTIYQRGVDQHKLWRKDETIRALGEPAKLSDVVESLSERVRALPKRVLHNPSRWQRARKFAERVGYFAAKPETLALQLDGLTPDSAMKPGGFYEWLIDGYLKSMTKGYSPARSANEFSYTIGFETRYFNMQKDVQKLMKKHFPDEVQARFNRVVEIEGLVEGRDVPRLTHENIVTVLLNLGNEENKRALLASGQFTEAGIAKIMRYASEADWNFVQAVWDYFDGLWPEVAAAVVARENRLPVKVTPTPIEIDDRSYRGGYYPIIYDRKVAAFEVATVDELQQRTRMGDFTTGMTDRGHTLERQRGLNHPLSLSMANIQFHLRNVAYDLELGDFVNDAWKILYDRRLVGAFNAQGQADALKQLQLWLMDITAGEMHFADTANKLARWVRSGFTLSVIGVNLNVAALQFTGVSHTMTRVSPVSLFKAFAGQATHRDRAWFKYPGSVSKFMAQREHSWNVEAQLLHYQLSNSWRKASKAGKLYDWYSGTAAMYPMMKAQKVIDHLTWYAALRDGMRLFDNDSERAINHADRVVAETQGTAIFGLRSQLERGTVNTQVRNQDIIRATVPFINYFMTKMNLAYRRVRGTHWSYKNVSGMLETIAALIVMFWFEAAIVEGARYLFDRDEPGEDELDRLEAIGWTGLETMTAGVPIVRDFAQEAKGFRGGGVIGAVSKEVGTLVDQSKQFEADPAFIKSAARLAGIMFKVPGTSQGIKLAEGVGWIGDEPFDLDDAADWPNMIYGPPRDR